LTLEQEKFLLALLSEKTVLDAARKAGIGETTAHRYLKVPAFKAAFRAARREVVEHALARLQQLTVKGVEALERAVECGHTGTEVRAADIVLERAVAAVEWMDFETRLARVEEQLKARGSSPRGS
jgi:hypothetical protein